MKIKLAELVTAQGALMRLFTQARPKAELGYRVGMMKKALAPALEGYEKARREVMQKHGTLKEDGSQFVFLDDEGKIDPKKVEAVSKEHAELVEVEIELDVLQLALNDLDRCKLDPVLSPAEIASIGFLLKVDGG
jgi:hypothetical protein